jgi:NADPH:quinone reductase-like Zn-dependent oxidoreductase
MLMQRAQYPQRGPVPQDVIAAVDFELSAPGPTQALLELLAAPINPSDVLTLTGQYGMLPPLPAVGGNEGVGRVVEVGSGVTTVKVGQTVLLPVGSGTWATHQLAEASRLVALPTGVDAQQLAMLTINPPTALLMLRDFVELQAGDWVIQNAANSAVGGYLVQIAALRGINVVSVVRRESAIDDVKAAGGEVVLVDGEDLHKRVAIATGGVKPRLAIDAVGGAATERLARTLVDGGTLVNYGGMSGEACQISPGSFVFKDITLKGFWLTMWFRRATPAQQMDVFAQLTRWIAEGKLKARVQATFTVAQIKQAVAMAAAGERDGKILLVGG